LTEQDHGLTLIDDPATLVYLGYGFENPRPGPWRVTVHATERTPPLGTAYAIVTQYEGGARIAAELSNHLPGLDEVVALRASLLVGSEPIPVDGASILL